MVHAPCNPLIGSRTPISKNNKSQSRVLRVRSERPHCYRATDQAYELAPLHRPPEAFGNVIVPTQRGGPSGARGREPEEVWHLWQAFVPRRSITGRLLWGTVLRRRDGGRWIYKKSIQDNDQWEYRRSAGILVRESRK
jgi:hypothetical protein